MLRRRHVQGAAQCRWRVEPAGGKLEQCAGSPAEAAEVCQGRGSAHPARAVDWPQERLRPQFLPAWQGRRGTAGKAGGTGRLYLHTAAEGGREATGETTRGPLAVRLPAPVQSPGRWSRMACCGPLSAWNPRPSRDRGGAAVVSRPGLARGRPGGPAAIHAVAAVAERRRVSDDAADPARRSRTGRVRAGEVTPALPAPPLEQLASLRTIDVEPAPVLALEARLVYLDNKARYAYRPNMLDYATLEFSLRRHQRAGLQRDATLFSDDGQRMVRVRRRPESESAPDQGAGRGRTAKAQCRASRTPWPAAADLHAARA